MLIQKLIDKKLISPPLWMKDNLCYSTIMGSQAYGTSTENSDLDIYAICIPPKHYIFPHLSGYISDFGEAPPKFEQFQEHHIKDVEADREYDINILSIVKVFELARQGNPNIIDMLFTSDSCVLFTSTVGNIVRENRKEFLSKKIWPRYKGYSYSQLKHLDNKNPIGKRKDRVEQHGFDTKFALHLVRLLNFAEQILTNHDLSLQENNEQLKAIRRGEWTEQQIRDYFNRKESELETIYLQSTLRDKPDEAKLKNILLDCLETHYGSLSEAIVRQDETLVALRDINNIVEGLKIRKIL